jgi:hypothetical protein
VATVGVQRTVDGVLDSADSATIQITDSAGLVVVPTAAILPISTGVYSYNTSILAAGDYTVTWTFVEAGFIDDVVTRTFTVESPVSVTRGVTLADIERAIARRVGPYWRYPATSGSGLDSLLIRKLRSNLDLGDYEEMWILRRGRTMTDALVPSFDSTDRQRLIAEYIPAFGALTPDRDWAIPAINNESIEFHYLDPEQELRDIARDGLRRCYFWDTAEISNVTTTLTREINISASVPWITLPHQIRNIEFGRLGRMATRLMWWEPFKIGADVYIKVSGLPVGNLRIKALRPHFTFVNGEMSYAGPDDDADILHVNLEYAARAGHIAAWASVPDRLTPVAAEGLRLPMKLVAAAFTAASYAEVRNEPELLQIPFGQDTLYLDQVGNA